MKFCLWYIVTCLTCFALWRMKSFRPAWLELRADFSLLTKFKMEVIAHTTTVVFPRRNNFILALIDILQLQLEHKIFVLIFHWFITDIDTLLRLFSTRLRIKLNMSMTTSCKCRKFDPKHTTKFYCYLHLLLYLKNKYSFLYIAFNYWEHIFAYFK